ncbi:MAG: DUF6473 family protein [Planctomycetota bacterium]
MSDYYQELDAPVFDYDMHRIAGIATHRFRGPIPDLDKPYFAVVGGAQTMGRFVPHTYGQQLAERIDLPCLNLGIGGAGPRFALRPEILHYLQRARFVIVQAPAGRSATWSLFDNTTTGRNSGRDVRTGRHLQAEEFFEELFARQDRPLLERFVSETRNDYAWSMQRLAQILQPPSIMLWLSVRTPDYEIVWSRPGTVLGPYPQLVDRPTFERFHEAFDHRVMCITSAGLPQRLWRDAPNATVAGTTCDPDGQLWNRYYPSPEMNTAAADALEPLCLHLRDGQRETPP